MRNIDGLQPSEALDELLKYLLVRTFEESCGEYTTLDVFSATDTRRSRLSDLRTRLRVAHAAHGGFVSEIFRQPKFGISDACLARVDEIMGTLKLSEAGLDIRSAAIRTFLGPEIRKSLGIFLTPDDVVSGICDFFQFRTGERVLDPACGSGTFLIGVLSKAGSHGVGIEAIGIDKSGRMMLLAEHNIGIPDNGSSFIGLAADSLRHSEYVDKVQANSVDYVLTNPPFGVNVDNLSYDLTEFATAAGGEKGNRKQSSELLFVEQSLKLLKPNGWLAIVLPKSALNTVSGQHARQALGSTGAVRALIDLPPETFASTGTMTNTVVLFVQKFGSELNPGDSVSPIVARVENVGFDSTGRARPGNQLPGLGVALRHAIHDEIQDVRLERLPAYSAAMTFPSLPQILKGRSGRLEGKRTVKLRDLVHVVCTGATPPRSNYSESGLFLVKVGNLTGTGVNWLARDRNFIDEKSLAKRYTRESRVLQAGDILLTSSAHSPKYIAKKIDVVTAIPQWVGGKASYVGEVMLIRPKLDQIAPFRLAAYLRLPSVTDEIQRMIRGQTAHLHADDVLGLDIDEARLLESAEIGELADLIEEETALAERINEIGWTQKKLADKLEEAEGR